MSIFLGYGLSLGIIGSGVGLILGLLFVWNINDIAALVGGLRDAKYSIRRSTTFNPFPPSSNR